MTLRKSDVEEVIEGVILEWFPGYEHMGHGKRAKQYRVVAIREPELPNDVIYEIRDHNNGQEICGRFVVSISVITLEEALRERKSR